MTALRRGSEGARGSDAPLPSSPAFSSGSDFSSGAEMEGIPVGGSSNLFTSLKHPSKFFPLVNVLLPTPLHTHTHTATTTMPWLFLGSSDTGKSPQKTFWNLINLFYYYYCFFQMISCKKIFYTSEIVLLLSSSSYSSIVAKQQSPPAWNTRPIRFYWILFFPIINSLFFC